VNVILLALPGGVVVAWDGGQRSCVTAAGNALRGRLGR
jgi:hypothetical protein